MYRERLVEAWRAIARAAVQAGCRALELGRECEEIEIEAKIEAFQEIWRFRSKAEARRKCRWALRIGAPSELRLAAR